MAKTIRAVMVRSGMGSKKLTAFTVAVKSQGDNQLFTCAVLVGDATHALDTIKAVYGREAQTELCGHLSTKLAAQLKLKPGKPIPI